MVRLRPHMRDRVEPPIRGCIEPRVDGHPDLEFATRRLRIGRNHFLDRATVVEKWREPAQLFLIVQTGAVEEWKALLGDKPPVIAEAFGSQTVLVNGPSGIRP